MKFILMPKWRTVSMQSIKLLCVLKRKFCVNLSQNIVFDVGFITTEHNLVKVNDNYRTTQYDIYAIGNHIKHRQEPNHQYRFVSPQESAEKVSVTIKKKVPLLHLLQNRPKNQVKTSLVCSQTTATIIYFDSLMGFFLFYFRSSMF